MNRKQERCCSSSLCSTACSESSSAHPGAALRSITCTASPWGFIQESLKSFRYRQHTPDLDFFFFLKTDLLFSGQTGGQLSHSASGSPAIGSHPAALRRTGGTAHTFLQDCSKCSLGHIHVCPWEIMVIINPCFTGI